MVLYKSIVGNTDKSNRLQLQKMFICRNSYKQIAFYLEVIPAGMTSTTTGISKYGQFCSFHKRNFQQTSIAVQTVFLHLQSCVCLVLSFFRLPKNTDDSNIIFSNIERTHLKLVHLLVIELEHPIFDLE